mmetsp:Transcript_15495/g.44524  ORF Transcript_15495/g.44524 Transcript_15495/m.44524 type:complete len:276 (-) Transcript_15495:514-1341(-)
MIWWSTTSWSTLSCAKLRITLPPSTPCSAASDIWAMSNVSKASRGGILTWNAGGGEGLRSWLAALGGPHSKARFCSAAACVGPLRSRRRSRCDHELELKMTRQRWTPGCIQPGSCCKWSFGPSWCRMQSRCSSPLSASAAAAPTCEGTAVSWRCTVKDGSHTAEPFLGVPEEKMSQPNARISASTSGTRTQVLLEMRKAPRSLATSCGLRRPGPIHCAMSVSTSASEAMGRSSLDKIISTSSIGSSAQRGSSVMQHKCRLCRISVLMSCPLSLSW